MPVGDPRRLFRHDDMEPPLPKVLYGRTLRRAALAVLLRANGPLTIAEVLTAIDAQGYTIASSYPRKALADALGWEHRRGWAVRVARGCYAVGTINRTSRWRILTRFR
jgi:hypothetical protein